MRAKIAAVAAALCVVASPAFAQEACPAGTSPAIIRLSRILPTGSMDGARKAAADHAAWYASHGYTGDRVVFAQVVVYDAQAHTGHLSPDQFYTFHWHATDVAKDKQDAAWAAYVAEYNKNSTIISTNLACVSD